MYFESRERFNQIVQKTSLGKNNGVLNLVPIINLMIHHHKSQQIDRPNHLKARHPNVEV